MLEIAKIIDRKLQYPCIHNFMSYQCYWLFSTLSYLVFAHLVSECAYFYLDRPPSSWTHIYLAEIEASTNMNEHHVWGGQNFQNISCGTPVNQGEHNQTTLVPTQILRPSSQAGIIASNSNNLFHPIPSNPISHTFTLPDVPFNPNPRYHAYNQQTNTLRLSQPLPSTSSSYNNPTFTIPPPPTLHNSPQITSMGPPPPALPHSHSQPVYNQFQPYYPTYNALFPNQIANNFPPHSATPAPPLPPFSRTLPTVAHIPTLTSKHDFFT